MASAKVGPKGQIVIPKEIREIFDIKPGDSLILLADESRGIAIERMKVFDDIATAIFAGKGNEIYPDVDIKDQKTFAKDIKNLMDKEEK